MSGGGDSSVLRREKLSIRLFPSSPPGILSSVPTKPIILRAPLSEEEGDGGEERVPSFPSGAQSNLSFVHVTPPAIEMGKCFCSNKFIQAALEASI